MINWRTIKNSCKKDHVYWWILEFDNFLPHVPMVGCKWKLYSFWEVAEQKIGPCIRAVWTDRDRDFIYTIVGNHFRAQGFSHELPAPSLFMKTMQLRVWKASCLEELEHHFNKNRRTKCFGQKHHWLLPSLGILWEVVLSTKDKLPIAFGKVLPHFKPCSCLWIWIRIPCSYKMNTKNVQWRSASNLHWILRSKLAYRLLDTETRNLVISQVEVSNEEAGCPIAFKLQREDPSSRSDDTDINVLLDNDFSLKYSGKTESSELVTKENAMYEPSGDSKVLAQDTKSPLFSTFFQQYWTIVTSSNHRRRAGGPWWQTNIAILSSSSALVEPIVPSSYQSTVEWPL